MMITEFALAPFLTQYNNAILFGLIILGAVEYFFFIRYGRSWIKRGVMVWKQPLSADEWKFLSNQQEDIFEEVKTKSLWYIAKSFVMIRDDKVLIRYGNPRQRTSWPMVGYVDLTLDERVLEFRMAVFPLLLFLYIIMVGIVIERFIISGAILAIFSIACFVEYVGLRDFLTKRTDLYFARRAAVKNGGEK